MEQWIYARLYESAMEIMEKANEKFVCNIDFSNVSEEDMYYFCRELNKTSLTIGKMLRNTK